MDMKATELTRLAVPSEKPVTLNSVPRISTSSPNAMPDFSAMLRLRIVSPSAGRLWPDEMFQGPPIPVLSGKPIMYARLLSSPDPTLFVKYRMGETDATPGTCFTLRTMESGNDEEAMCMLRTSACETQ